MPGKQSGHGSCIRVTLKDYRLDGGIMHDNTTRLPGKTIAAVFENIGPLQTEIITAPVVGYYFLYCNGGIQQLQILGLA